MLMSVFLNWKLQRNHNQGNTLYFKSNFEEVGTHSSLVKICPIHKQPSNFVDIVDFPSFLVYILLRFLVFEKKLTWTFG